MHFFNPAHAMRLLEIVRTADTTPEVLATLLKLGRRLGKVPVLVGAGEGFVANRMLSRRSREALFMLEEGAEPEQIDRVLVEFGFPLGPLRGRGPGRPGCRARHAPGALAAAHPARARGGSARAAERPRPLRAKERGGLVPLRRASAARCRTRR